MVRKFILYVFFLQILFVYTNTLLAQGNSNVATSTNTLNIRKTTKEDNPKRTVITFLKWYKANEKRLDGIIYLKGGLKDTTTFYSVDFKETETYLNELKKSNFLSDFFIYDLRKYFAGLDNYLKQHPQNDGPVSGQDVDLVIKAQDYMDVWENLNSSKIIFSNVTKTKATIKLQFIGNYKTIYSLTKHGDKWLLDRLDNAFADN